MILLIDNYDSFTYNLVHYLADIDAECEVRRNDALTPDEALKYDAIIISPGPCDPDKAGICLDVIKQNQSTPILGVCLGHEAIGQAYGGKIIRTHPMHGKTSKITHGGKGLFAGIPSPFTATRYHSLIVERESLPDCLEITAETEDGIIMGLQHKDLPIHGVQFHPESIASEHGHEILRNFVNSI
ncbi:MAG: aminodeoxychorismate/anthranilate synthase component II [Alphaproteobacteria bacterium CG11_big_fil_rev_8_21_14_0_20_44_7]|nr:MAG: aminodeoxychorismate/anthranilate synthase component II [Alphaproteobacteria bacterium CG11_big_fil_rev_8_21_14_0_20_44_7]